MSSVCLCLAVSCSLSCGNGGTPTTNGAVVQVVRRPVSPKHRLAELGLSVSLASVGHFNPDGLPRIRFLGAKVDSVRPHSPAARAGLRVGDIISEANGRDLVKEFFMVEDVLGEALAGRGKSVKLLVHRNGELGVPLESLSIYLP